MATDVLKDTEAEYEESSDDEDADYTTCQRCVNRVRTPVVQAAVKYRKGITFSGSVNA